MLQTKRARLIAALAAYVFVFFFVVWVKVNVVQSGYKLQELEAERKKAGLALADLEYKLGQVTGAEDVFRHAKDRGYKMPGEYGLEKIRYPGLKLGSAK